MPEPATIANAAGALVTLGLGIMALVRPSAAAEFTSLSPKGLIGVSEIRATYGGLFAALGAFVLLSGDPGARTALGLAWVGAAVGRMLSVVVDRSRSPKNLGGVLFEAAIGGALLWR